MISLQQHDLIQPNATVTSLMIADKFGKQHGHILRSIDKFEIPDLFRQSNFGLALQNVAMPNGAKKETKVYEISRDGFSLLVMGFTGKKAMAWKIKFLEAFNAMEKQLAQPQTKKAIKDKSYADFRKQFITEYQASELQRFLKHVVTGTQLPEKQEGARKQYYAALKKKFGVTRYKNIPADQYTNAISFITNYRMQEEPRHIYARTFSTIHGRSTKQQLEHHLASALYYLREIHDPVVLNDDNVNRTDNVIAALLEPRT